MQYKIFSHTVKNTYQIKHTNTLKTSLILLAGGKYASFEEVRYNMILVCHSTFTVN